MNVKIPREGFLEWFDRMTGEGVRVADKAKDGLMLAGDVLHNSVFVIKLHSDVAGFMKRARSFINIAKGK